MENLEFEGQKAQSRIVFIGGHVRVRDHVVGLSQNTV